MMLHLVVRHKTRREIAASDLYTSSSLVTQSRNNPFPSVCNEKRMETTASLLHAEILEHGPKRLVSDE